MANRVNWIPQTNLIIPRHFHTQSLNTWQAFILRSVSTRVLIISNFRYGVALSKRHRTWRILSRDHNSIPQKNILRWIDLFRGLNRTELRFWSIGKSLIRQNSTNQSNVYTQSHMSGWVILVCMQSFAIRWASEYVFFTKYWIIAIGWQRGYCCDEFVRLVAAATDWIFKSFDWLTLICVAFLRMAIGFKFTWGSRTKTFKFNSGRTPDRTTRRINVNDHWWFVQYTASAAQKWDTQTFHDFIARKHRRTSSQEWRRMKRKMCVDEYGYVGISFEFSNKNQFATGSHTFVYTNTQQSKT